MEHLATENIASLCSGEPIATKSLYNESATPSDANNESDTTNIYSGDKIIMKIKSNGAVNEVCYYRVGEDVPFRSIKILTKFDEETNKLFCKTLVNECKKNYNDGLNKNCEFEMSFDSQNNDNKSEMLEEYTKQIYNSVGVNLNKDIKLTPTECMADMLNTTEDNLYLKTYLCPSVIACINNILVCVEVFRSQINSRKIIDRLDDHISKNDSYALHMKILNNIIDCLKSYFKFKSFDATDIINKIYSSALQQYQCIETLNESLILFFKKYIHYITNENKINVQLMHLIRYSQFVYK
jgi:hypothetical protein